MARCEWLLVECRGCQRLFRRDERYERCPDCGSERQCRAPASSMGGPYCVAHGGTNMRNKWKGTHTGAPLVTGKQSKSLIPRMASKYLEQTNDSMYMLNKKSIDLIDARILELLDRTDSESSPERMERIVNLWREFRATVPNIVGFINQDKQASKAFYSLEAEIEAAFHDYAAWRQIFEALELRRKHTESEMKILKDMKALMTAEEGMELASQLFAAILKVLKDEPKGQTYIHLIRIEFERITGAGDISETSPGREEIIDIDTG